MCWTVLFIRKFAPNYIWCLLSPLRYDIIISAEKKGVSRANNKLKLPPFWKWGASKRNIVYRHESDLRVLAWSCHYSTTMTCGFGQRCPSSREILNGFNSETAGFKTSTTSCQYGRWRKPTTLRSLDRWMPAVFKVIGSSSRAFSLNPFTVLSRHTQ